MVQVVVIAEGQTEEAFIKQVVAPALHRLDIFLKPILMPTSPKSSGGAVTIDRFLRNARNILRQDPLSILTTFLDLYGLDTDFPAYHEAAKFSDVYLRVGHLQQALKTKVVSTAGCNPLRFIPHIQPYEFEGLLFSDVTALCSTDPGWATSSDALTRMRACVATPEHINDSFETKPSSRLETTLDPRYRKTTHGPLAAKRITLEAMERECPHFKNWMNTLRTLS